MSAHKDDGSTSMGAVTVVCILLAYASGYWTRELGVRFSIDVSAVERRLK